MNFLVDARHQWPSKHIIEMPGCLRMRTYGRRLWSRFLWFWSRSRWLPILRQEKPGQSWWTLLPAIVQNVCYTSGWEAFSVMWGQKNWWETLLSSEYGVLSYLLWGSKINSGAGVVHDGFIREIIEKKAEWARTFDLLLIQKRCRQNTRFHLPSNHRRMHYLRIQFHLIQWTLHIHIGEWETQGYFLPLLTAV